ncbi:MAG: hypothetical protein AMJ93_14835, partial [Anaerolineae bacterium SM23_84]
LAKGSKSRDQAAPMVALTMRTGSRIIALAKTAQQLELAATVIAHVFIERHGFHLKSFLV